MYKVFCSVNFRRASTLAGLPQVLYFLYFSVFFCISAFGVFFLYLRVFFCIFLYFSVFQTFCPSTTTQKDSIGVEMKTFRFRYWLLIWCIFCILLCMLVLCINVVYLPLKAAPVKITLDDSPVRATVRSLEASERWCVPCEGTSYCPTRQSCHWYWYLEIGFWYWVLLKVVLRFPIKSCVSSDNLGLFIS